MPIFDALQSSLEGPDSEEAGYDMAIARGARRNALVSAAFVVFVKDVSRAVGAFLSEGGFVSDLSRYLDGVTVTPGRSSGMSQEVPPGRRSTRSTPPMLLKRFLSGCSWSPLCRRLPMNLPEAM